MLYLEHIQHSTHPILFDSTQLALTKQIIFTIPNELELDNFLKCIAFEESHFLLYIRPSKIQQFHLIFGRDTRRTIIFKQILNDMVLIGNNRHEE